MAVHMQAQCMGAMQGERRKAQQKRRNARAETQCSTQHVTSMARRAKVIVTGANGVMCAIHVYHPVSW